MALLPDSEPCAGPALSCHAPTLGTPFSVCSTAGDGNSRALIKTPACPPCRCERCARRACRSMLAATTGPVSSTNLWCRSLCRQKAVKAARHSHNCSRCSQGVISPGTSVYGAFRRMRHMQRAHQVQSAPPAAVLVGPLAAQRGLHAAGGVPSDLREQTCAAICAAACAAKRFTRPPCPANVS